jgi:DNA topoisomerase I
MILVIVESPAKCKKIESYLGPGYKCVASFGHIREINNGLKGIDFENNFNINFRLSPSKNKYITTLRKAIKSASEVILATDDDREGEAISWHICKAFNLPIKTTKRIIFNEITKSAIKKAITNPKHVNMDIVNAQLARQVLDLLVGFTISPMLWKHISRTTTGSLSAGRCQTPALRLVYEQQKLINESPGKKVYDTVGIFLEQEQQFSLNKHFENESLIETFLEETVNFDHEYSVSKPKTTTKNPPKPFTTSLLQQKASNEFNFSPKQTMRCAQILYENGLITYMRTDSAKYSKEFITKAKKFIKEKYGEKFVNSKINLLVNSVKKTKKDKKDNAQEAHEAIRPTKITNVNIKASGKITAREVKLYYLIWRNTMESCMSPATFYHITSQITAPLKCLYKHTEEQVIFPGWKIVEGYEKINDMYYILLKFKRQHVEYKKVSSKVTLKDLKKNYSEARLVQMLEKKGIGRPSTFSNLISKIQDRNYVKKQNVEGKKIKCTDYTLINDEITELKNERVFGNEKNKLVIQPIGIIVYEFLEKYFDDLFNYDYTKNMEDTLDIIAKGDKIWYDLCRECNDQMAVLSKSLPNQRKTYKIDEHHEYMIGRYGPVIKCTLGKKDTFKGVKKNIDIEKLKNGEYTLQDIVEEKKSSGNILGQYKDKDVILKEGQYGLYASYNNSNVSLKGLKKTKQSITLQDVINIIEGKIKIESNIIKNIDDNSSIRKGKWGNYVYYKTSTMKKPKFIKMGKTDIDDIDSEWVNSRV